MHPHFSRDVSQYDMAIIQLDPKHRIRKRFATVPWTSIMSSFATYLLFFPDTVHLRLCQLT